jgi:hypothetical protein
MFVDDFVELNFSDRNFLNLRPNPDTNLAFHGVCPETLTIPLKQRRTVIVHLLAGAGFWGAKGNSGREARLVRRLKFSGTRTSCRPAAMGERQVDIWAVWGQSGGR